MAIKQSIAFVAALTSAHANLTTASGNLSNYNSASFMAKFTGLDAADGTVKLQYSNTGTAGTWKDVAAATTLAAGDSLIYIDLPNFTQGYLQSVFTKGSNTVGTQEQNILVKG